MLFIVLVASAVIFRGKWWPIPFEALSRQSLAKYENQDALGWLEWATWLAPESGNTAFLRARIYRRIGQMNYAADALKRADKLLVPLKKLQREQWLAQAQSGQLREVESHLSELLIDPRGDTEEICEAFVLGYLRTQRQGQALQILKSWIDDWPTHARPLILRAKIWSLKSKFADAESDLRQAVKLEPANPEALIELATILQRGNQYDEAVKLFERNLNAPRYACRAHLGMALCLKVLGENSRVLPLLEKAVKLAPDNPEALRELGRVHLENGQYSLAISKLQEAVRITPRDDESHYLLAQSLKADGKTDEAQPHFDFVQKVRKAFQELDQCEDRFSKNPRDVEALVRAGEILLEVSDPEEGVLRLLTAIEIDPKNEAARKLLADHYSQRAETNPNFRSLAESFRPRKVEPERPTP